MPSLFIGDWWIKDQRIKEPLSEWKGQVLGVEASYYLQNMISETPAQEPLLPALGGEPMGLKKCIRDDLDRWAEHGMTPVFVFEGQSTVGKENVILKDSKDVLAKVQEAWDCYTNGNSTGAVKLFGLSGAARVNDLYPILREVLDERGHEYKTAPYSACAQLTHIYNLPEQYIDGLMGSQELLLYDGPDTVVFPPRSKDWDAKVIHGVSKQDLISRLGVTPELFADALLMVGTSFLRTFPTLEDETIITRQPYQITDAFNLLRTSDRSVTAVCTAFHDVLTREDPNWLDNYRKAKLGIKHCITVNVDGSINIKDYDGLTGDNHEYLGLQLPAELYHYLTQAVVGPRLLNNLRSLEITVLPTLDGEQPDEYKTLVTKQLIPIKEQTIALLTPHIHRAFKFKDITMRYWFDDNLRPKLNRSPQPDPNSQADTWAVRSSDLKKQTSATKSSQGKLSFSLLALDDKTFTARTIFRGKDEKIRGLDPSSEVIPNVLWRLLHLRGYINDEHELTPWGRALKTTYEALRPVVKKFGDIHHIEDAAFLAYELLRLDNLNTHNQHKELIGGSIRGSDEDKASCMLIGRTACLLKLRHKENGYTGPLSKVFLLYNSLVKVVREADRDLMEAITATMLMSAQVDRSNSDLKQLGRSLPLATDVDIGLGIAVKTFLDDHIQPGMTPEQKEHAKRDYAPPGGRALLPLSVNFVEDLEVAFTFFDALYEGVKTLGKEIPEADFKAWGSAKEFLDQRR
ncbi:XPG domain-containing protein [Phlyctema vagabunda]|uniref:XPG domain-containing protein n=1 Tax=Phlyctema vagabunda TaxID=108571 RepID=A0ABR4PJA4_9HELO